MRFKSARFSRARPPARRWTLGCGSGAPVASQRFQIVDAQAMMHKYLLILFALSPFCHCQAQEPKTCAATINELRVVVGDQLFPLKWVETSMTDDKPLVVSILESNGTLLLQFIKTGEGLWAESSGVICSEGATLQISFTAEQIRIGPSAHWFLRRALGQGGKFTLTKFESGQLRIATSGWSGMFLPMAP